VSRNACSVLPIIKGICISRFSTDDAARWDLARASRPVRSQPLQTRKPPARPQSQSHLATVTASISALLHLCPVAGAQATLERVTSITVRVHTPPRMSLRNSGFPSHLPSSWHDDPISHDSRYLRAGPVPISLLYYRREVQ
jgi:hypothetical protein